MNSTVISGTPRTNSMKITENSRTAGMRERRPSASTMPIGSENDDADRGDHDGHQHAAPLTWSRRVDRPISGKPSSRISEAIGITTKK